METFNTVINKINGIIWSNALVILCLCAGIYFSIRMKFPQFRLFREMGRLIVAKPDTDKGITPFQSFAATVGSRVGMGNVAGVATAIYFGGPGAVFWMWAIALIGAGSAFSETTLAQAYKRIHEGVYVGGPAHFMDRGLHLKPLAVVFACATILGPGLLMPGVQVQSIAATFDNAWHIPYWVIGVACVILVALVTFGGVKRISRVAELLAPVMCVIYLILAIVIIVLNIRRLPGVIALIFQSAFGAKSIYAGIMGSTIAWGVKRGVYSNEAGQGSGAIISASAECSHLAKQGLVQAGSVYIDTLLVCSCTAFIILLTGTYNVADAGGKLITANVPNITYGVLWTQTALMRSLGAWVGKLLAVIIILFVFTSLMGYYYQAESNVRYLSKENKAWTYVFRCVFLVSCYAGVVVNSQVVWSMGDIGCGGMAWCNIIAILLLSNKAVKILRDYEKQRKAGVDPMFDPEVFGVDDPDGVWDEYAKKRKEYHLD